MRALKVTKQAVNDAEKKFFADEGVTLLHLSPTLLSAMTSMKISKAVDANDVDVVLTTTLKDTIAALSARKIASYRNFRVMQILAPNSEAPRSIPAEVLRETDGWVLPSERMLKAYPSGLRNAAVIAPVAMTQRSYAIAEALYKCQDAGSGSVSSPRLTISWIGGINDSARLNAVLDKVDEASGAFVLRICGAGKARDVMPAVRHSRALDHKDSVVWVGEEYNVAAEIEGCHAAVRTDRDLTLLETEILRSGRCVLGLDEIVAFVEAPRVNTSVADWVPSEYVKKLKQYINQLK